VLGGTPAQPGSELGAPSWPWTSAQARAAGAWPLGKLGCSPAAGQGRGGKLHTAVGVLQLLQLLLSCAVRGRGKRYVPGQSGQSLPFWGSCEDPWVQSFHALMPEHTLDGLQVPKQPGRCCVPDVG